MIKKKLRNVQYYINDLIHYNKEVVRVDWYAGANNFGDILNPILLEHLTDRKILNVNAKYYQKEHLLAIGSVLGRANSSSIIWGAGFISENSAFRENPKKVCAVRGPKTRKKIIESGIDCPKVYGDPALLMPFFYHPNIIKRYKVGIIPHYMDKNHCWIKKNAKLEGVTVIDILNPDPLKVIDKILACEKVMSSSLHGLIVSDAYGIPSIWVKFFDRLTGGNFKFLDYFLSVDRKDKEPVIMKQETELEEVLKCFYSYEIRINLHELMESFPAEFK